MATFVLVHGGWHGGWCWQKVIPFLEAAGHEVYAPTLTGLAERASELSPDIGLDTHIQDIVGLLEEKDLQGVILVGHSYGGMVITGVVDAVPERIAHLVYLDTFVPRDGESMVDVSPMVIRLLLRRQAQAGWLENRSSRHLRSDDRARSQLGAREGDATTPEDVGATASSEESRHRVSETPYVY